MRMLLCLSMLGYPTLPASAEDEVAPRSLAIKGEVRYHFREQLEGVEPGGKKYSAPAYEKETVVNGRVAHLPYRFVTQLDKQGALEVNVLDREGNALQGYPRKVENPFADQSASQEFEIPVAPELAHTIERKVLAKNQHLTEVQLVVKPSSSEGRGKRSTGRQAIGHEPSGGHLGPNTRITSGPKGTVHGPQRKLARRPPPPVNPYARDKNYTHSQAG
jgi:hypothetical protein